MSAFEDLGQSLRDAATSFKTGAMEFGETVSDGVDDMADSAIRHKLFIETGKDLFTTGAVTTHGGNLSATDGESIWITRTNSMLGRLTSGDLVKTTWQPSATDANASRELIVHRAMYFGYQQGRNLVPGEFTAAIVHAHTKNTILRTLLDLPIVPIDSEGLFTLGEEPVKVISPAVTIGSEEAADLLGRYAFDGGVLAVIKGHGPFAIAEDLLGAHRLVSVLEASCAILNMRDSIKA